MAKFIVYAITVLVLVSLNSVFPSIRGALPNFLFLLVVFYSLRKDEPDYLWIAFFSGLLLDTLGNAMFGMYTISFLAIGELINYATRTMFTADPSMQFVTAVVVISNILLIGLAYIGNSLGYMAHFVDHGMPVAYLKEAAWISVLLNLAFALPIYVITSFNDRIILKYQKQRHG